MRTVASTPHPLLHTAVPRDADHNPEQDHNPDHNPCPMCQEP
jgi:hypothetical protein